MPPSAGPMAGGEEELVAGDGRLGASALVRESGAGDAGCSGVAWSGGSGGSGGGAAGRRRTTTSSSPMGRGSCSSDPGGVRSGPLPAAIACCHAAPIGNLGMRTHATRHFDCTANLHKMMRSAFLDRHLQHERGTKCRAFAWDMVCAVIIQDWARGGRRLS